MTDAAVRASTPSPDNDAPAPEAPSSDKWRRVLIACGPGLVYLGVRLAGVLMLMLMASRGSTTTRQELTAWDGHWLLGIAEGGYEGAPANLIDANQNRTADTTLAFFPGYPGAVRAVASLPLVSYEAAGFLVTLVAGIVAAYGVARIGELVRGGSRRAGLILVALFAASPMAVVLSMTYSEALFCAFAAWALVFVLQRWWLAAAACCALAGLVRPTAFALVIAVGAAAAVYALSPRTSRVTARAGALAACFVAPAGLVGYLWWAGSQMRPEGGLIERLTAWSDLQRTGWGWSYDGGLETLRYAWATIASSDSVHAVGTILVLGCAIVLAGYCVADKVQWPVIVYGIGVLIMVVGTEGLMNTKARLLLAAFVLLIPVAVRLAQRSDRFVLGTLAAAAIASGWFGAQALVGYAYAI